MITILSQASFLFIKASLYSIAYKVLIEKEGMQKNAFLAILCNFLVFLVFSKIEFFTIRPVLNTSILLLIIAITSSYIFSLKLIKSILYIVIIFFAFIKASIFSSYISLILFDRLLPLMNISSAESILFIPVIMLVIYTNLLIVKKCFHNYISLSSRVSFNMLPFLLINTAIFFVNFSIHFYGYSILKGYPAVTSNDLVFSVIFLLLFIEFLMFAFLILYHILMKNNIRLAIVKDIADNDALTGVLSREKGLSILKYKIRTSKGKNNPLTICFIDINNLKKVNDRYGHEEGDRLIEVVSSTIKNKLRRFDIMCRLGGDEFLIVFDSCSLDHAKSSWVRIEEEISKLNSSEKFEFSISVSSGFAEYNKEIHTTIKSLIKEADDEMYRQKKINKFYEKVNKKDI